MDELQERQVARGLKDGRPDAWRIFYDAFSERVWRAVARRLGGSSSEVADVVQETFLAAAKVARQYDPGRGTLWNWLWGIARLQAALQARKAVRRLEVHSKLEPMRNGDCPDPLEAAELQDKVRATLIELPMDYELLLTAKYLDGESVEAIARRDGSTPVAVRSRLARARQAFREIYDRGGVP